MAMQQACSDQAQLLLCKSLSYADASVPWFGWVATRICTRAAAPGLNMIAAQVCYLWKLSTVSQRASELLPVSDCATHVAPLHAATCKA
jgi:hypothetical protein